MTRRRTFTHLDVLTTGVDEGWAERETDPTKIDWAPRQAAAAIPFRLFNGRPVNPCEKTRIRYGRNQMGRWGETLMGDALVIAYRYGLIRFLLMIERDDGNGWAVPGGHAENGETGTDAALRELTEETGLAANPAIACPLLPRYIPDPRASDEAWAVTIPVRIDLGMINDLPAVAGGDDARRAAWILASSYYDLTQSLQSRFDGIVFKAHRSMLRDFLRIPGSPAGSLTE